MRKFEFDIFDRFVLFGTLFFIAYTVWGIKTDMANNEILNPYRDL